MGSESSYEDFERLELLGRTRILYSSHGGYQGASLFTTLCGALLNVPWRRMRCAPGSEKKGYEGENAKLAATNKVEVRFTALNTIKAIY